jgi:hypothetical protein
MERTQRHDPGLVGRKPPGRPVAVGVSDMETNIQGEIREYWQQEALRQEHDGSHAVLEVATRDAGTYVNEDNLESDHHENEIPKRDRTGEHPPPVADDYDVDGSIPWPRDPSPQSHYGDSYWVGHEDSKADSIGWVTRQRQLDDADSRFNPLPWWPVYCADSCCDPDGVANGSNATAREIRRSRTVSETSSELSYRSYESSTGSSDLSKFRHKHL